MLTKNQFIRSHGLGNDYLVMDPAQLSFKLTPANIVRVCDRNKGVGSDGILTLEKPQAGAAARLRIWNPDGSEAEKSGNGLRIFCKALFEHGYIEKSLFEIETAGGRVTAQLHLVVGKAAAVTVEMGKATFEAPKIPVNVPGGEVLDKLIPPIDPAHPGLRINCVSVGNPHCVVFVNNLDDAEAFAHEYGPLLEKHPLFPNRTNVQFAVVDDRKNVSIRIWERGAGYTLASGSSSCAVAAVCVKRGFTDGEITLHMPGGDLSLKVSKDFDLTMRGPVEEICLGTVTGELLTFLEKNGQ